MAKFDFGEFGSNLLQSGTGSLVSGAISSLFGGSAQKRATEASLGLMREQQKMQRQNNLDAATLMRQSKEKAGFNVNADGSISPSLTPPQAGQTAVAPDTHSVNLLPMSQVELNEAQARDLNATAGLKERELKGRNEADQVFSIGKQTCRMYESSDGMLEFEILNSRDEHITTREGFEAIKEYTRWLKKELPEINASQIQAFLQKEVATRQYQNNKILDAMVQMPLADFEKLKQDKLTSIAMQGMYIADGQLKLAQESLEQVKKELANMDKTERENSSIGILLNKIDVAIDNKDILGFLGSIFKLLFMSALNTVSMGMSVRGKI